MKYLITCITICLVQCASAQHGLNGNYRSLGMGGAYMFNINDAALNTNPSLLGWQASIYDHRIDISLGDFWAASKSPVANFAMDQLFAEPLDINDDGGGEFGTQFPSILVWEEMITSFDYSTQTHYTYDTIASRATRQNYKEALIENNSYKQSRTYLGFTYRTDDYGVFSFKVSHEVSAQFELSETFADLWAFGKTSSYFDTLVQIDGSHLANNETNYQNETLNNTYLGFSTDTLTINEILGESNFELMQTRNYTVGWGKQYGIPRNDYVLYVGANLNIIEGLQYVQIQNTSNELTIANFSAGNLSRDDAKTRNTGLGASLSFSGTIAYKDKWLMSAGVNNLGFIRWKRRKSAGSVGAYSNTNQEFSNTVFGVSKTEYFNDQLEAANFNWGAFGSEDERNSVTKGTASNFHLGVRRQFGSFFSIGANLIQPLNTSAVGSSNRTLVGLNYELTLKKFSLFSGINNMDGTTSMPLGFSIGSRTSKWEAGISISDLLGYVQKSKDPKFSIGVGVKFRIW